MSNSSLRTSGIVIGSPLLKSENLSNIILNGIRYETLFVTEKTLYTRWNWILNKEISSDINPILLVYSAKNSK